MHACLSVPTIKTIFLFLLFGMMYGNNELNCLPACLLPPIERTVCLTVGFCLISLLAFCMNDVIIVVVVGVGVCYCL